MQTVAQAWLVYRLTGSAYLLGAVGFTGQIPVFFFSWLGGLLADRYDRRRLVIGTQSASMILAFVLSGLTVTETVQIWHVFVLAGLLGIVNTIDVPARQSLVAEIVGKENIINAVALNSSIFNGARVLGPALAGILVSSIGEGWCFFLNGVSYIAVISGLLFVTLLPKERASGFSISSIVEGFRYARATPPVRILLIVAGVTSLVGMPFSVLMPVFADRILHGGPSGLGILMGATGVGAIIGAFTLAVRPGVFGLGRLLGFGVTGFALGLICFSASESFWLSVLFLMPVGYCQTVIMGSTNTLLQSMAPDALRGRVMSLYSMMFLGMMPFGAFVEGAFADRFGAPLTVLFSGIGCLVTAAVFFVHLAAFRNQALKLIAPEMLGEAVDQA
jgi:MFS family permease